MTETAATIRAFGQGDGDLAELNDRAIAFLGYGNQGRAQALNLRDSLRAAGSPAAERIAVGALRDETWEQAQRDGFAVSPVDEAARAAGVLFLLLPDEELADVFAAQIAPHLRANGALVLASGYNLAFDGGLTPPEDADVLLLAPRMIGRQMRELFERGRGFYSYVSVEQDASGRGWPLLLALAKGIGSLSPAGGGALELSARDEAVLDIFHEQAFGSVLSATMLLMIEVGLAAGLPAEALVLDYYLSGEMAETFQTMADLGFVEQARLHSRTSQYGGMMRSLAIDREPLRKHFQETMEAIRSGAFARQWAAERASGYERLTRIQDLAAKANPFTPIEARLRAALAEAHARRESER